MLREYARFLKAHHMDELVQAQRRLCEEWETPWTGCPLAERWLELLLGELAEEPTGPEPALEPAELALAQVACRQVLVRFIPRFTRDVEVAVAIVSQLEAHWRLSRPAPDAERLKDEFLSIISHELRTPLNAIIGFGSILEDELAGPLTEAQHAYLAKIFEGAEGLLALVDDVLDMSLIRAGRFVVRPSPMPLARAIDSALQGLRGPSTGHAIVKEIPPDLPPVMADLGRIRQLVSYMLTNALKFTPASGTIRIRARLAGDAVRCEVCDSGPGVPSEAAERLFERFTQLDMGPTRQAGGTGLGLSICRGIIQAHGGTIGLERPATGGACFYFSLPLAERAARVGHAG